MPSSSSRHPRDRDRHHHHHNHHHRERDDRANEPASIPISQLQMSPGDQRILAVAQHQALADAGGANSRSSRAASAASSQGRLLLDPSSLQALSNHFDRLIVSIQTRWTDLYAQSQAATQGQYDTATDLMAAADAEMARMQQIMDQIDELQNEWDKIARIGDIVKTMRDRVLEIERRL